MGVSGRPAGVTCWRTGEKARASSAAAQSSWLVPGVRPSDTAVTSRADSSAGTGVPALGGRELSLRARTNRPASRLAAMSATQLPCSSSTRRVRPVRSSSSMARASSSWEAPSPATTTERRSRRSSSSRSAIAAAARSFHSASRRRGYRLSAIATTWSTGCSGRFSVLACSFWATTASRTAGTPPRSTCSAMARCSSGTAAITALRCARPGRSRLGLGRSGTSGRGPRGRSGRSPRSRRSRRGPSPSRSRRRPRPSPRPRDTSWVVTSGSSRPEPMISSSSGCLRVPFGASTSTMSMPSMRNSASARSTSPTLEPPGSNEPLRSPLGSLAPAARQVQVPSGRSEVSSISSRRDMAATLTDAPATHVARSAVL